MTTTVAQLIRGGYTLDLNSGRYSIHEEFRPAEASVTPVIAGSTPVTSQAAGTKAGEVNPPRQFAVPIVCQGNTKAEVIRAAKDIYAFLQTSGLLENPTYFVWRPMSDYPYEPRWGEWGCFLRYVVEYGTVRWDQNMITEKAGGHALQVSVVLTVKAFAEIKPQRLAQCTGFIFEDIIGTVDGIPRGTQIGTSSTNLFTNPVFGHLTDLNGWTVESGMRTERNYDPRYIVHGHCSQRVSASGADRTMTQSMTCTAVTHAFSCYVKKPDGDAVTSADINIIYNAADRTTNYFSVGDGWYRIYGTATGTAGAAAAGVRVKSGRTMYVDGFQAEIGSFPTALGVGDMLGATWSGTAHASSTTRSPAGFFVETDATSIGEQTIMLVWKPNYNYTTAADFTLFQDSNDAFSLKWINASTLWRLTDGTNTASSSATTFSFGDKLIFHVTAGAANGLKLYLNGTQIATNSTYTPAAAASFMAIGHLAAGGSGYAGGTFMGFSTFDHAMTAAQVALDYANIVEISGDDQRVGALPWLWTFDGDGVVEACIESGSTCLSVAGAIPGTHRARTRYHMTETNGGNIYSCVVPSDEFVEIENVLFHDASGTVTSSADCGGAVDRGNPGTTDATLYSAATTDRRSVKLLSGKNYYMLIRIDIAGADDLILYQRHIYTDNISPGEERAYDPAGGGVQLILTPPVVAPSAKALLMDVGQGTYLTSQTFSIRARYAGASTGNVDVDYFLIMPEPLVFIELDAGNNSLILEGLNCKETDTTFLPIVDDFPVEGSTDGLDLFPNQYNMMATIAGTDIDSTVDFVRVFVTPRFALL